MKIVFIIFTTIYAFAIKPDLLLLKTYNDQNISGWVMSEKLDGIRAYWDGKQLLSRNGNIIHAPKYFTINFPQFELDGELWSKRDDFEHISSIVRDKTPTKEWNQVTYNIFEVPNAKGNLYQRLNKVKPYTNKYLKIIPQIPIKNKTHMKQHWHKIKQKNAEGLVLRNPTISYTTGRSANALKLKSFCDTECKVIAHNKGNGKYKNILGSITCKMNNGITFNIGSGFSDKQRHNPPQIGSIVTFKYQSLTKNKKPRFPVFLRVRNYVK